jgi:hypothetical protein
VTSQTSSNENEDVDYPCDTVAVNPALIRREKLHADVLLGSMMTMKPEQVELTEGPRK